MQEQLADRGRKVRLVPPFPSLLSPPYPSSISSLTCPLPQLVAIVDPHVKRTRDLYVYQEAQDLDILCKKADGKTEYEGHCWTGSSAWVDWFNPKSHDWWVGLFKFDKFKVRLFFISSLRLPRLTTLLPQGSTSNLHIWNDMNEVRLLLCSSLLLVLTLFLHSHRSLTAPRSPCTRTLSTTVVGSTAMFTTSTE